MTERKGFDRLVNFTDAVVAIAITLLILPPVSAATALGDQSVSSFIDQVMPEFLMFLLSFVIIANYWLEHHRLFRRIDKFDAPLLYLNFVWMLGIVIMPFTTAVIVNTNSHNQLAIAWYVGTMFVISLMQYLMNRHVLHHLDLEHGEATTANRALGVLISTILLAVALVVGLLIPSIGLWALFVMFLVSPIIVIVRRSQKRRQ